MQNPKRKLNVIFFLCFLPAAVYLGYCIGLMYGNEVTLDNLKPLLFHYLLHSFPLRVTPWTWKAILICGIIWFVIFLRVTSMDRDVKPGTEYGTASFGTCKEVNKKLADPDPANNKILSQNLRISLDTHRTGLNNNVIIIGGSGAGKSFRLIMPNILAGARSSLVITDPKSELRRALANSLEMEGYRIVSFNLVDMDDSDGYNPFAYIRSDNDIIKLVTNMMNNTRPKDAKGGDPFWDSALSLYLQAIMSYVWYECPKHGKPATIREMMDLLNKAKVAEKAGDLSELDQMMEVLPDDHPARVAYLKVRSGAKDTIRSIIISAHARLAYLQNPKILKILDHDDIDIRAIGEGVYENPDRKTALFCIIPDNDKSYSFLIGLLYTQIFQELYYIADFKYGGSLPIHVAFWMDEFANTPLPDGFTEIISTMRSRNMSANIILQNRAQLQALFKDTWQAIIGNCDTMIYLGGNEPETHKYMTEMLGKYTLGKRSSSESLGSKGSASSNFDVVGRELMTPDEVRRMDNEKELVFIRGCNPIMDDKFHTLELPEFIASSALGSYVSERKRKSQEEKDEIHFYIDAEGEDADCESYFYQIEQYMGVFRESRIFDKLENLEGRYLAGTQMLGSFLHKYSNGQVEAYPVFSLENPDRVYAGGQQLIRYPICGFLEDGKITLGKEEEWGELFQKGNEVMNVTEPDL
ncbi:VirD4-like conjugal transfer protein, CD1115 family [Porcincola intestinalis]|uniref:Type IV secretory system conjugative DNA transfer family protein n=2 Tax=Porcincola intestinalis TaxID=2606632 RepID=A0A6L5X0I3_9FIRM|nr:type IV secretory system conjugative DNA transfer family protein [Porcincola intestinalis]MSS13851.1 type IV secretory system conjugative DNA transfer family protein [Porcincola intestinalis]